MPHPCAVCGRSRMNPLNRHEDYVFFGFPVNDDQRCSQWLEFCCRNDLYKLTKKQLLQRMVCSKHFAAKDFLNEYLDRLNCSAVPSIYDPKQSLYNITCTLCNRSRKDPPGPDYDGVTFHHFPGEEFRCLKWLDFVGVESYYRLTRKEILYCYICSKHFDSSQFINNCPSQLSDNAVPNIRFPDESNEPEFIVDVEKQSTRQSEPMLPLSTAVLESQACAACNRMRSHPLNKQEKYKFHPFPAYEIGRCLKWCKFLGREDLLKMSPNQIRKLVLCSKHFEAGQSFHKVGPCDAVPTIYDPLSSKRDLQGVKDEDQENPCNFGNKGRTDRPLVSSKKPKIENKPAPLAKKRGKSRRPISFHIPKPAVPITNRLQKLPLPPSNWNFQPIAITSNFGTNTINDVNNVILPFTGDISNLGTPIPVRSLSSIPPGLLIKIDLPNHQEKKSVKTVKNLTKKDEFNLEAVQNAVLEDLEVPMGFVNTNTKDQFHTDLETFSNQEVVEEIELHDEEIKLGRNIKGEHFSENVKEEIYKMQRQRKLKKIKKSISPRTRRTVFPISAELRNFLGNLKPHMSKLPKKAKAQIKLFIVNQVIEKL